MNIIAGSSMIINHVCYRKTYHVSKGGNYITWKLLNQGVADPALTLRNVCEPHAYCGQITDQVAQVSGAQYVILMGFNLFPGERHSRFRRPPIMLQHIFSICEGTEVENFRTEGGGEKNVILSMFSTSQSRVFWHPPPLQKKHTPDLCAP